MVRNELAEPVQTNPKIFLAVWPCLSWGQKQTSLAKRMREQTCIRRPERLPPLLAQASWRRAWYTSPAIWPNVFKVSVCGDRPVSVAQNVSLFVFGMRLADEHGVRHLQLVPRCLAKHVQGATCVRRPTPQLSGKHTMYRAEKSERPVLGGAYDVRRPQDFGPRC